jgi:hypothetical protein
MSAWGVAMSTFLGTLKVYHVDMMEASKAGQAQILYKPGANRKQDYFGCCRRMYFCPASA